MKVYNRDIFKFSPNFLKVNFPANNAGINAGINNSPKSIKLNSTQEKILGLIKKNKYITQEEMSEKLNKNIRTIERNIKKLQTEKLIVRVGSNKDGYWDIAD